MKFGTARILLGEVSLRGRRLKGMGKGVLDARETRGGTCHAGSGEVVAAVFVAEVPREKNRQRFESLKGLNAGGLLACVASVERG